MNSFTPRIAPLDIRERKRCRIVAGLSPRQTMPVELIPGSDPPAIAGEGYHYETRGGTRIHSPSAYSRRGWSNMVYISSSRRVEVGEDWIDAQRRMAGYTPGTPGTWSIQPGCGSIPIWDRTSPQAKRASRRMQAGLWPNTLQQTVRQYAEALQNERRRVLDVFAARHCGFPIGTWRRDQAKRTVVIQTARSLRASVS